MTEGPEKIKVPRRLAAVLAADIAGYSALMGADEEATVRDLKAHQAIVLPMIGEHSGRLIDNAGDGVLAEFSSVLGAVKCALAIQKTMAERNATIEPSRRMQYRIGVNQGDVVFDEVRIYGDGVNVAARLEGIANAGGICLSGKVYDEIHGRLELTYEDIGPQQLKNIAEPVRVYRIDPAQPAFGQSQRRAPLALPDKPSVAVLPFSNLSADPSQDYFSDGITEDIIIELSRFSELFVIARNSSFQYKGKSIDVRQVGRELGVRYVLEGSIRRVGERVRFAAKLVDAATGAHRWAERYDRELKDVFAVQDEVARTIVAILAAHVNKAEAERTALKPPATWQAYDYYMRAADGFAAFQRHSHRQVATIYETRRLIERCLAIDPDFARAYYLQSRTQIATWSLPLDADYMNPAVLEAAHRAAERAVQLDANLAQAHYQLGYVLSFKAQREAAVAACERAVALNPNYADDRFAGVLVHAGQRERAIHVAKEHLRLDPFALPIGRGWLGLAYYMLRRYGEAVAPLREFVSQSPNFRPGRGWLAATYAQLGRLEEARAEAAEVLRLDPSWTSSTIFRKGSYLIDEDVDHLVDGLHKAGLPEK